MSKMKTAWTLILLGAPGSGKGTQARTLSRGLHIPQISTGDMLRMAVEGKTALGRLAEENMRAGNLVHNDIIFKIVRERLNQPDCRSGLILDGFPRTPEQARFLDEFLEKSLSSEIVVFHICIDQDLLVKRTLGRRVCSVCGNTYNIYFRPPLAEGLCDKDGELLTSRLDDNEDTILRRARAYVEQTQPLIEHYAERGVLYRIDGDMEPETVSAQIYLLLGKMRQDKPLGAPERVNRSQELGEAPASFRSE